MAQLAVVGGGGVGSKGATQFPFGKHRGKSYAEVADTDPGYCDWALRQDNVNGAMKDFVDYVRERRRGEGGGGGGGGFPGRPGGGGGGRQPVLPWASALPAWKAAGSNGLEGGRPSAGVGSAQVAPGGGFRGPAGPGAPGSQGAGLGDTDRSWRTGCLPDGVTLVMELVQDQRFLVRAEKAGPEHGGGPNRGTSSAFMPQHVWGAIGGLPGASLAADRRSWLFPVSAYEQTARALEDMGTVERIPAWVFQMIERARKEHHTQLDSERLPSRLLPYQLEGVRFGAGRGGRCLIGDEMGLGKTLQALALAAQYTEDWPVLVVCPSSLRWVWKEQAEEWLPGLVHGDEVQVIKKGSESLNPKAAFWIISYNLLATDAKKGKFQQRPDGTPHVMVIADESHNIKEWSAARTKALVPILRNAKRSVCLSGTPTRNSPDELHPQLCGLLPWLSVRFGDFRNRYCVQQQSQLFNGRVVSKIVGARNSSELNHLLTSTVMVRRLKKEVLSQLPEKRRQRIPIEVSDARVLKEIRSEMRMLVDNIGNPGEGNEGVSTLFMKTAKAKLPAVKEYITEVLDRGDEKAIIFAHHQLMLEEISVLLDQQLPQGTSHIRIDGKTPAQKRPDLVRRFQEDPSCRIALLSITACGEGLTLTAAGLVIFAELYWVPGAVEQAEARAHRIGTTHTKVIVEFLVVPNSPDEIIYNSLERKKKDTSHVLDGTAQSLDAVKQLRERPVKKRAGPEVIDLLQAGGAKAPEGAGEAGEDGEAAAAKRARVADGGCSPGPKGTEAAETPPPVSRSKIDFLLRAVRAGQKQGTGGKPVAS